MHLSIFVLVINQLDAHKFTISLFHACTCFEHHVLIVRRSKLYSTASGVITPVGGVPVHRLREVLSQPVHGTATYKCDDTRGCIEHVYLNPLAPELFFFLILAHSVYKM